MLATMQHRGPDRQQGCVFDNAAMGQALLATTPEALAERQPWVHPQSGRVVVSDSRLDNRPQLLAALGIVAAPDQVGDGELLHAAWERWGPNCADRLRGDFAFAIWDAREQRMFAARDPMGVRPFYLHYVPEQRFVFASSADAVLAHGGIDASLDEGRIADALVGETEGIDAICTFFENVQRLPPAQTREWQGGRIRQARYWHPLQDQPAGLPTTDAYWIDAQRDHLEQAVRLRLRSYGRVGSMLSGGLDSSAVVALASRLQAQQGEPPFPAFSAINTADTACAETTAIRAVLAATRSEGHLVDLQAVDQLAPALLEWLAHLGEPFDRTLPLVAAVFHNASQHGVRAIMDGVPADNLFTTAGYDHTLVRRGRWLAAWQVKRGYLSAFHSPKGAGLRALARLPVGLLPPRLRTLRQEQQARRQAEDLVKDSLIDPDFARRVDLPDRVRRYRQNMAEHALLSADARQQSSLGVAYITAGLERYNRVASHFSIEPRPPFADRDLIAFQARVPWHLRLREGWPKWILRKAMQGLLPPHVAWRRGKEHLGHQYSAQLLCRVPGPMAPRMKASAVARYLAPSAICQALISWEGAQGIDKSELLQPVLLDLWLQARRGQ